MAKLILNGSTSGSVTLDAPAVSGTTTLTLPTTSGTVITTGSTFAGTGPAFSAYPTSSTSIGTGTFTKITFNTEEYDTNNNFASSRFTPTVAGYYFICAAVCFGDTTSTERVVAVYKNGSSYKWGTDIFSSSTISNTFSCIVYCNGSTDYIEVYAYSGTSVTTTANSFQNYFQGYLARSA
jgi:hypothetical protein